MRAGGAIVATAPASLFVTTTGREPSMHSPVGSRHDHFVR